MDKETEIIHFKITSQDGVEERQIKQQVLSNLSHAHHASNCNAKEKVLTKLNCAHSDKIEQQLKQQRACLCAQDLLCFHSTSDCDLNNLDNQFTNGLTTQKCSSVSNDLKSLNSVLNENQLDKDNFLIEKRSNYLNRSNELIRNQSKQVKRIGVFYSDLCDVVKSMRSFSSQSPNSSFKSDKTDKENLLDNLNENSTNKILKTMVKAPLNQQQQQQHRQSSELSNQQNGLNQLQQQQQQQTIQQQTTKPSKLNVNQQPYFKMNEQLITKDKKSLLKKVASSEQNLFKQFNQSQLLQVPAENTDFNQNTRGNDQADAFSRLNNQQQQQSNNLTNSISTITVNGQTNNNINANSINNNSRQLATIIPNLPDLLHSHAPPPPYQFTTSALTSTGLINEHLHHHHHHYSQYPIGGGNTLSLRQIARLQQSIPINSLPNNITTPLSLNIARSRNSTAALLSSASLSPNNNLLNARVHQSLLNNTLNNQLNVPIQSNSSTSLTTTNSTNLPSTAVPLTTQQPTVIPPHVHHQFRFPLNAHRFTASSGHFLGADLDTITSQSKSCLSCTSVGLRWGILLIAFIGLLSVIIGTCLFAVRPSGRDNFTLAIILLGKSLFVFIKLFNYLKSVCSIV